MHTVNFGTSTGEPSCTCPNWVQWIENTMQAFFAILINGDGKVYHISTDAEAFLSRQWGAPHLLTHHQIKLTLPVMDPNTNSTPLRNKLSETFDLMIQVD